MCIFCLCDQIEIFIQRMRVRNFREELEAALDLESKFPLSLVIGMLVGLLALAVLVCS